MEHIQPRLLFIFPLCPLGTDSDQSSPKPADYKNSFFPLAVKGKTLLPSIILKENSHSLCHIAFSAAALYMCSPSSQFILDFYSNLFLSFAVKGAKELLNSLSLLHEQKAVAEACEWNLLCAASVTEMLISYLCRGRALGSCRQQPSPGPRRPRCICSQRWYEPPGVSSPPGRWGWTWRDGCVQRSPRRPGTLLLFECQVWRLHRDTGETRGGFALCQVSWVRRCAVIWT